MSSRKLKIAQISPLEESVPPRTYGGTERVVDNLTRGLSALGHEVVVFCTDDSNPSGGTKHAVWPEALRLSKRKIEDPFAYRIRMLAEVAKYADDFDVIHNHYDYPLLPLSLMTEVPVITTMHGRMDLPDLPAALEPYPNAPLVSISDAQRILVPQFNWLTTVLHGIDANQFQYRPTPGKYLAFLGRFSPEKAPHWAIEIAKQSGVPLKIAAKIEGKDAPYYEQVVKPLIDGKFIEYIGEIREHEKSEFLGNALATVFPIDWPEPFGLVMVESMACGTPVLARPMGSVSEVMTDGITGFVRSNVSELASLVDASARLDRSKIRKYAENKFCIERMTREYLHVYDRLISTNNAREGSIDRVDQRSSEVSNKQKNTGRVASHRRDLIHPLDGSPHWHTQGVA